MILRLLLAFAFVLPLTTRAEGFAPPALTKYTTPSGHQKLLSDDDLRRVLDGEENFQAFKASGMTLNEFVADRNSESLALTIAEVLSFTLGVAGTAVGVRSLIAADDAAFVAAGLGLGVVFLGAGAGLVWADLQDYGAIWHPELELRTEKPRYMLSLAPGALALAVTF